MSAQHWIKASRTSLVIALIVSTVMLARSLSAQAPLGIVAAASSRTLWPAPYLSLALEPEGPATMVPAEDDPPVGAVRPHYEWLRDLPIMATGAGLLVVGSSISASTRVVPAQGLDPNNIHLGIDRNSLSEHSTQADHDSDYLRAGALSYPMLVAFASQPSGDRLGGTLQRSVMYLEALGVSEGISTVVKRVVSRPRPYAYLPDTERPTGSAYDVTAGAAFESMPSGHAVISFTAAAFAMTDHLLTRPDASWKEQAGVAAIGGFLAGMTSALRVEGGQHFPTDTFVGAVIGETSGVAIPLVHHYLSRDGRRAPYPSGHTWILAVAGQLVGVGAGVVTAYAFH